MNRNLGKEFVALGVIPLSLRRKDANAGAMVLVMAKPTRRKAMKRRLKTKKR
ncbi:hypothetical protein MUO79_11615 [Candidatus Bathyarchaeota archaeon]|nr:hypothetical protein [Candidatus Bathyarchaeota archaeon]